MAELRNLPPSAKYVLDVVEREGPIRRQTLLAETTLPESTLDRALGTLQSDERVILTRDPEDLRHVLIESGTQ